MSHPNNRIFLKEYKFYHKRDEIFTLKLVLLEAQVDC